MDPRIQYLTSPDGTKIAYWTLGEGGTPLLMTSPMSFSNITEEWKFPAVRSWYEALAASRRVVGYDQRGCGSSQREIADFSAEAHDRDLEAVADRADTSTLDFMAFAGHCSSAMRFAATHPERVRRLVLWSPSVRDATNEELEALDAFLALAASNWTTGSEVFSHSVLGWSRGEEAHANAAYLRATINSDDFVRLWRGASVPGAFSEVVPLLPRITAKTLVVDQPNAVRGSRDATIVASEIPNAELLRLEGGKRPHNDEHGRRAVEDFLAGGHVERPVERRADAPPGMTAILFADIVDSTALTERLGDTAFREKARALDSALRTIIRDNGGTPIDGKLLGDGVLATFASASQAIAAALACGRAGDDGGLPLHLGLHAGDVIREENNVYGGAVNIASRIAGLSAAGEVLVSETVRSLARTSAGVRFEDRGEQALKGVGEPVRVWAVAEGE